MALTKPRRSATRDPEGRMPLREHLAELRNRFVRSGLAIIAASVAGWYLYSPIFKAVQEPLQTIATEKGIQANIAYTDVMQAFNLHLKIAVYLGILVASPVWLYQAWAFVVPGLTRKEKRRALAFSLVGAPLFGAGIWVGWLVVPNAVGFFASQAEPGTSVLPSAGEYLNFVTQLLLVFGIAFLLPLVLVALNLAGVMSAMTMAKGWRLAVFLVFLFAAVASPTPDAGSMLALALPMVGLYMLAVGFAWMVDRRRAKASPYAGLSDDEASPLGPVDDFDPHAGGALIGDIRTVSGANGHASAATLSSPSAAATRASLATADAADDSADRPDPAPTGDQDGVDSGSSAPSRFDDIT